MSDTWWHCGIPLGLSEKLFAIFDVILGVVGTTLLVIYYDELTSHFRSIRARARNILERRRTFPPEFTIVMLVTSSIQIFMGVLLFVGATRKSRRILKFWMFEAALSAIGIFTFLPRLYGYFIVAYYDKELKQEEEAADGPIRLQASHSDSRSHELSEGKFTGTVPQSSGTVTLAVTMETLVGI